MKLRLVAMLLAIVTVSPAVAKDPLIFSAVIGYPRHQPKLTVRLDDKPFRVPLSTPLAQRGWWCVIRPDPTGGKDERIRDIQCTDRMGIAVGTVFICGENKSSTLGIGSDALDTSVIISVWCN